jgi:hypothetical protein
VKVFYRSFDAKGNYKGRSINFEDLPGDAVFVGILDIEKTVGPPPNTLEYCSPQYARIMKIANRIKL